MQDTEAQVAEHYTNGALQAVIDAGWAKVRSSSEAAPVDQLAGVDEFHIGGRVATEMVCDRIDLAPGIAVLDVGCGLGGAARFMASRHDLVVEGIDLTPEYVQVGNTLTRAVGLDRNVRLSEASALNLPFGDATFDRVTMFHVGMNIENKDGLFSELARVLKPGGLLAVYDVMRTGDGALAFPVPWAATEATSFVRSIADYVDAMERAGLSPRSTEPRRDIAEAFFAKLKAMLASGGPPPLGLHLLMGSDAPVKVGNMARLVGEGVIAPVLITAAR